MNIQLISEKKYEWCLSPTEKKTTLPTAGILAEINGAYKNVCKALPGVWLAP